MFTKKKAVDPDAAEEAAELAAAKKKPVAKKKPATMSPTMQKLSDQMMAQKRPSK